MAAVVDEPITKEITKKLEPNDSKINAMDHKNEEKVKESFIEAWPVLNAALTNRAENPVSAVSHPSDVCVDDTSMKGIFGWQEVDDCYLPYIMRTVAGSRKKFVSVRMAETQLLSKYLKILHNKIYSCVSVRSLFITRHEAALLNKINGKHSNCMYGRQTFNANQDVIVLLSSMIEFHSFVKRCCDKLLRRSLMNDDKFGFIRIDFVSVVPYCKTNNQKYLPLFFFEYSKDLELKCKKIKGFDLAYLYFCCKVMKIKDKFFASDSCLVVSLDVVKECLPVKTNFEEFWPNQLMDSTGLLRRPDSPQVYHDESWTVAPPPTVSNVTSTAADTPEAFKQQQQNHATSFPKDLKDGVIAHQLVKLMADGTAHQEGKQHLNQSNSLKLQINGQSHNVANLLQTWLMVQRLNNNNGKPVVGSINQEKTSMHHSINTSSGAMDQPHNKQLPGSCQAQKVTKIAQSYSQPIAINKSNPEQMRNIMFPTSQISDFSRPSLSTVSQAIPGTSQNSCTWIITRITERRDKTTNHAYKIQTINLENRRIACINGTPFVYTDLLVTVNILVNTLFPTWTVNKCADILYNTFKIQLFGGNSEQTEILRENKFITTTTGIDQTPLVRVNCVKKVIKLLNTLFAKEDIERSTVDMPSPQVKKLRTC